MNDKYKKLAERIGSLVDEKNQAYGNSFREAGTFLKLLYPDGISPDKYGDMLCIVRIFDKLKRIATKKGAFNESPYVDIVGYGLLGTMKDEEEVPNKEEETETKSLLQQLKEATVISNVGIFGQPKYLILKIMEEGNSIRLAPLKEDRLKDPYIAEELSEVVETNIVEMGLKELLEGLKRPIDGWQICSTEPVLIFGECHYCKTVLPAGVPVKNMINGDKFAHQGCFEDYMKSLKNGKEDDNSKEMEEAQIGFDVEIKSEDMVIDGINNENHSKRPPKPNMAKPFKNKKKHAIIRKKNTRIKKNEV